MKKNRVVWMALTSLILFSMACNPFGGTASDVIEDQFGYVVEDQIQQTLEDSGNAELIEDFGSLIEDISEGNWMRVDIPLPPDPVTDDFYKGDWTRADIPLPPDAVVQYINVGSTEGDMVLLETPMSVDEGEKWIIGRLKENAWSQIETQFYESPGARFLYFSKGDEGLVVFIEIILETGGTYISIQTDPFEDFSDLSWTRADIPLPPDAVVQYINVGSTEGDGVMFETSMSLDEVEAWIIGKLKENGWSQGDTTLYEDQRWLLQFSKGDEGLILWMDENREAGVTHITIHAGPLQ